MSKLTQLRRMFCSTAWAVQPDYLQSMLASLELLSAGGAVAEHTVAALRAESELQMARRQQIAASSGGAVAVLPLYGCISQRSSWFSYFFGGTTTEGFTLQFRQALADPNVTAIVIDIDSPGGSVAGVDELAAEIFAARGKKTIVAVSNTLAASAAYYIGVSASKFVVSPSSLTGSIGVYNTHEDDSAALAEMGVKITLISAGKFKVEGNSFEPLTPEARAAMQAMVDGYYKAFTKAVAKGRGVKTEDVVEGFGEGRVVMASDAVRLGMADKVGTLDSVLLDFGVKRTGNDGPYTTPPTSTPSAAKADGGDVDDDADDPCQCPCDPCMGSNCSGCTATDCDASGCMCAAAKKSRKSKAEAEAEAMEHLLALHQQRTEMELVGL